MQKQDYEQLTLFPADSPASRFPWLESKKAKQTTVTSGRKCSELSENLRRVGQQFYPIFAAIAAVEQEDQEADHGT